ncbi:hypothetical protein [Phenylobacterium sp.]|jgi:hypothetical protein|uniref:hypothetical protein n=1 Tax=Phenylobacterium sp. TaxID=1871053 RepID=UPI002F400E4B
MALYTFHFCDERGLSASFEAYDLPHDAGAFAKAGELLGEHMSCDHVDVRQGERPIVARHRDQPIIRPINEAEEARR